MCFFRRNLAKISARIHDVPNILSSSPTSSNSASSANSQRPQPAAGHVVFHSTKTAKEGSSRLSRPNIFNNQMNDSSPLLPPMNTQDDVYLALKIEKALELFDNDAWSPGHPQNDTLYNFIYDMAQHLLMIPTHLGLSLCECVVEDALVCLGDRSNADFDAFGMSMEVDLEQIFVILDDLSTYAKRLT